jgi:hypothetical protein
MGAVFTGEFVATFVSTEATGLDVADTTGEAVGTEAASAFGEVVGLDVARVIVGLDVAFVVGETVGLAVYSVTDESIRFVVSWTAGAAVDGGELMRFVNACMIDEEPGDSSDTTDEISGSAASTGAVGKIVISAQLKNCSGFKNPLDPSRGSG